MGTGIYGIWKNGGCIVLFLDRVYAVRCNKEENRVKEEDKQIQNEEYNEYVKQVTPTNNLFGNMVKAFIVGGVICVIGQVISKRSYEPVWT